MATYYLVDGYGFLHAGMHAFSNRPLRGPGGENTSATFIVTNLILRLLKNDRPDGLVWVHDAGDSGRKEMYPEYKANRGPMEPQMLIDFRQAKARIVELAELVGVPLLTIPGFEADDVIGTLAGELVGQGHEVVVVSSDKDLHQLIRPGIKLLQPKRGNADEDKWWVHGENAHERFGIEPEQVVDYLALLGDTSDNVPGVPGVGAKTAVKLLAEYGNLENLLEKAGDVKAKKVKENLLANRELALLSKKLVSIQMDVPHGRALDGLACKQCDWDKVKAWLLMLGFHSIHKGLDIDVATGAQRVKEEPVDDGRDITLIAEDDDNDWGAWAEL